MEPTPRRAGRSWTTPSSPTTINVQARHRQARHRVPQHRRSRTGSSHPRRWEADGGHKTVSILVEYHNVLNRIDTNSRTYISGSLNLCLDLAILANRGGWPLDWRFASIRQLHSRRRLPLYHPHSVWGCPVGTSRRQCDAAMEEWDALPHGEHVAS